MSDGFHRVLSSYYKDQRNRSEKCLGAILDVIADETESQPREKIRELLIAHYSHAELPDADRS